jgi:TP901 family phage tail tape measure protein
MTDIAALGFSIDPSGNVSRATNNLKALTGAAGNLEGAVDRLKNSFTRFTSIAGASIVAAFSVRNIFAYKDALDEVSTLVDTSSFSMKDLSDEALRQAEAFGNVQGQVKAYYQIISAGASTVDQATDILSTANKLAIGGVTGIAQAADGLTSVLNAYGSKVASSTAVSDAMFVAMRAGKTTIGELSSTLGRVAPLAAQAGVSFDELTASVSALTKGGIKTEEAVTGVRAILAAVAKPSDEAAKLAEKLGLSFNSTALKSQGLAGFLDNLKKKTGGSTDALAMLFGGVEALVPVMALSGQAGKDFQDILGQMAVKAGSTEEAFRKMEESPGFQMSRLLSGLSAELIKMSSVFVADAAPAMKFLADNIGVLPGIIQSVSVGVLGLSTLWAGQYVVSVGAATIATDVLTVSLRALRVAFMATGIGLVIILIADVVAKIYEASLQSKVFGEALKGVSGYATELFGFLRKGSTAVSASFDAVSSYMTASFVKSFSYIYEKYAWLVNLLRATMREFGSDIADLDTQPFRSVLDRLSADAEAAGAKAGKLWSDAFESESDVKDPWAPVVKSMGAVKPPAAATDSLKVLNHEQQHLADSYAKIVLTAKQRAEMAGIEAKALGMTAEAANRMRIEQELLNKAAEDHIKLTSAQKIELAGLAVKIAEAEERTRRLTEVYELGKESTRGFFSDLRKNLEEGKSAWESFGNAAQGALNKIADKAMQMLADGIWDLIFKSFKGGIGSAISGGGISGLFSANGNVFQNGVGGYANQVVTQPTAFKFANGGSFGVMGEAGPEAVMPLSRNSSGRLGVQVNNPDGGGGRILVEVHTTVDNEGNIKPFVQRVSGEVAGQVIAYATPGIVERATRATGQSLGRGAFDREMAGYGASRQPRSR